MFSAHARRRADEREELLEEFDGELERSSKGSLEQEQAVISAVKTATRMMLDRIPESRDRMVTLHARGNVREDETGSYQLSVTVQ